jgi:hypothetical protein
VDKQQKEKLDRYIDELQRSVVRASTSYHIWWIYRGTDTLSVYIDTINQYPLFFMATRDAHFSAMIVALYGIYEKNKSTFNIPDLMAYLSRTSPLEPETIATLANYHGEATPLWEKARVLRNNTIAHRSRSGTPSEFYEQAGVSADELKALITLTEKFLNALTADWNQSTHAFSLNPTNEAIRLLDDLTAWHRTRVGG